MTTKKLLYLIVSIFIVIVLVFGSRRGDKEISDGIVTSWDYISVDSQKYYISEELKRDIENSFQQGTGYVFDGVQHIGPKWFYHVMTADDFVDMFSIENAKIFRDDTEVLVEVSPGFTEMRLTYKSDKLSDIRASATGFVSTTYFDSENPFTIYDTDYDEYYDVVINDRTYTVFLGDEKSIVVERGTYLVNVIYFEGGDKNEIQEFLEDLQNDVG